MSTADELTEMVRKRQRRAVATIMSATEKLVAGYTSESGAEKLRSIILDEIGDFAELILSILPSVTRDDVALNGRFVEMLEEIHSHVVTHG